MTTAELELLSVFAPTSPPKPKDPYNGFGEDEYGRREAEKKAIRQRQRAMKALAADPQTPNWETWHCVRCFRAIGEGESFYLHYLPEMQFAIMKCAGCHDEMEMPDVAPFRQSVLVREVLGEAA